MDLDLDFADGAVAVLLVVGLVIVIVLLVTTVIVPVIAFTIELIAIVALFLGGLAGRLLFRRPWTIRAESRHGRELTWDVAGFRRSGRVRDEVAAALAAGRTDIHPTEALAR